MTAMNQINCKRFSNPVTRSHLSSADYAWLGYYYFVAFVES